MTDQENIHIEQFNGRRYVRETPEIIRQRREAAERHVASGKSYKYAWKLAFSEVPRTYIEDSDEDLLSKGSVRDH